MDIVENKQNKSPKSDDEVMVFDIPINRNLEKNDNDNNQNNTQLYFDFKNTIIWKIIKIVAILTSLYIGIWIFSTGIIVIVYRDYSFVVFNKYVTLTLYISFGIILLIGIFLNYIENKIQSLKN